MKERFAAGLAFALLMFMIPLFALNKGVKTISQPIEAAQSVPQKQNTIPANTPPVQSGAPPETAPSETAPLAVDDGGFRLLDASTGKLFEVSAKDYVRGALAAEMPPTFHPEALKAQAVAAHTYALNLKRINRESGEKDAPDFTVDPKNWKTYTTEKLFRERYGELADAYWNTISAAADEVCRYIVTYGDEPIVAAYCAMSSGMTEDAANVWTGSEPYLVPVESRGDTLAPDYETKQSFDAQTVSNALKTAYPKIQLGEDPSGWFEIVSRSDGGYVTGLNAGDQQLHGKELRSLLDLRSSNFEISYSGSQFVFTVKGYGHGVGLSQYGADYEARQGLTFDEILAHYYPGTTLAAVG